ncbi:hypothetical protein Dimus_036245 [Dionaea muscipula]
MRGEESDEPLSDFVKKAKRNVKVSKPAQKKKKEEKKETSTRGVDPMKKRESGKEEIDKEGKKYEAHVDTESSRVKIPRNDGIYNYMKGFGEESKYYDPLETTRRFAHDDTIIEER